MTCPLVAFFAFALTANFQPTPASPPSSPPAATRPASDSVWTLPPGWSRVPGERPMRLATFRAGDIEISLTQFPGDVGGMLANVNRWRGQIKLPPITEAELKDTLTPFTNPGFQGNTMRLKGAEKQLLGAAIFEPGESRTWFVKAVGTPAEMDKLEPSFLEFAKSFRKP